MKIRDVCVVIIGDVCWDKKSFPRVAATTNPTWTPLELTRDSTVRYSVTNRLSYGTACSDLMSIIQVRNDHTKTM